MCYTVLWNVPLTTASTAFLAPHSPIMLLRVLMLFILGQLPSDSLIALVNSGLDEMCLTMAAACLYSHPMERAESADRLMVHPPPLVNVWLSVWQRGTTTPYRPFLRELKTSRFSPTLRATTLHFLRCAHQSCCYKSVTISCLLLSWR